MINFDDNVQETAFILKNGSKQSVNTLIINNLYIY
jgi:hypothetical protein